MSDEILTRLQGENAALRQQVEVLKQELAQQDRREQRLQVALKSSPVVIFYQDRDLRYTWAFNPHQSFTPESIVGKTDHDLLPRESADRLTAVKRRAQQSGQTVRDEVELVIQGESYHYDLIITPLTGSDQPVGGIIGVACDLGARRRAEGERQAESRYREELEQRLADHSQELARSWQQLEKQSSMLRSVLDSMSDGVTVADTEGRFLLFNPAGERIIGLGATDTPPGEWPARYGLFLSDGSRPFDADDLPLVRAMRGEVVRDLEVLVRRPEAADVLLLINASPLLSGDGKLLGGVAVYRDISASKLAQRALADSEERFRQLAENINEVFWLGGVGESKGVNLYVSPAYTTVFGRDLASLQQSPSSWFEAIHPDDRHRVQAALADQANAHYDVVFRIIRPDGGVRWIHDRAFPVRDAAGNICRVAGIAEDITQRKEFEQRLEADELMLRRLLDLQERERQLTASEIHDGLAQHMVGAHMRLEAALDRVKPSDGEVRKPLESAALLMQLAIREARRMIVDLRPMILDERGIVSAIQHLTSDRPFCDDLDIEFSHDVPPGPIDPMLQGTIFRIVQEALNNVRKHSQSRRATVRLEQTNGTLSLEVQDWGAGFDAHRVPADRFGLQSIQQRARLFGGTATIASRPGDGTLVKVKIPLRQQEQPTQ